MWNVLVVVAVFGKNFDEVVSSVDENRDVTEPALLVEVVENYRVVIRFVVGKKLSATISLM